MKKLIPVFAPMLFVTLMFLTFFFTHDVQAIFDGGTAGIPNFDRRTEPERPETEKPVEPTKPPKALPVEDEPVPAPVFVSPSPVSPEISKLKAFHAPFSNRIYGWKKKGQFRHNKQVTFNSDGSVSQNFWPGKNLPIFSWESRDEFSLVLKNSEGWVVDVYFEESFASFTGYLRGGDVEFSGKLSD